MSEHAPSPAPPGQAREARGTLRVVAFAAVGVGLAALAGAAFVLSYAGIHAVALQAGVSHRLAKGYPLILDVLLVVVVAAVLASTATTQKCYSVEVQGPQAASASTQAPGTSISAIPPTSISSASPISPGEHISACIAQAPWAAQVSR